MTAAQPDATGGDSIDVFKLKDIIKDIEQAAYQRGLEAADASLPKQRLQVGDLYLEAQGYSGGWNNFEHQAHEAIRKLIRKVGRNV